MWNMYKYNNRGILFSLKKEGNPVIWNNMDDPGRHYAKWYKPEEERQILYGSLTDRKSVV